MKHWYRDTVFSHIAQPYSTVEQLGVLPEYLQTQARIWQDTQH